ncbi:MAG: VCBS repeat-containing protein [Bacteroidota bacterium]|nr:VCBS repeat-containing protein [Bacteroidota bacterium]
MFKRYSPPGKKIFLFIALTATISIALLNSCHNSNPQLQQTAFEEGRSLALKYCVSCHRFPEPSLIDRESWVMKVLPAMGKQLGVHMYMGQYFCDNKSALSTAEWQKIAAYYKGAAPVALTIPRPSVKPLSDWAIFSLQRPGKSNTSAPAMTTMISFNPADKKFYTADAANNLYRWDRGLNATLVHQFDSPVTGLNYFSSGNGASTGIITCIGNLAPVNLSKGKVMLLDLAGKTRAARPVLITDSLPRPVQTVAADFNRDGLMDYVVCAFGHDHGALYLLQQQPNHTFKKLVVSNIAGGEQLITGDFNNDGWPDVMCLFAQADEGIRMFLNDRKGGFTTQTLLRFPPAYGSSSFQLVDFNHDGKPDILYTCGDNSDFSKVLKPYHGVYIFTNVGNWKFKQSYFYHLNGATKAIAADFDHSGNLGIAVIAFFPDLKFHPEEGFTYLEQVKPDQYMPHEIPIGNYGRWLTMEVADIDQDGLNDIILGNFSTTGRGLVNQTGFTPKWDMHEPIIVLKNISGKKKK